MADNTHLNPGSGGDTVRDLDRSGVKTQIVALDLNPAGAESLMAGTMPVNTTDLTASGNITTQNLVPAGTATASSAVAITLGAGTAMVIIGVQGTYTGVLSVQFTVDGTNWVTVTNGDSVSNSASGATAATIGSAAVGAFTYNAAGMSQVRVTGLAAMTGTANITLRATMGVASVNLSSQIPNGSATIGTVVANPLTPVVTTTGDTGAKVATGNGATQTNTQAKGATIVINLGAVSGTTPSCTFKIQGSADAGTTWVDIPNAVTASLLTAQASAAYGIQIYPGVTVVAPTTTASSMSAAGVALPRNWRVVWTIAGTTPSFTITNIQVSYHLT